MTRACGALTLEEERHAVLAKAHVALAAARRLDAVEETREAVREVCRQNSEASKELVETFGSISAELLADKATMLVVLTANGSALSRCSPEFRSDPDLVLAACSKRDGFLFGLASPEMRADRDLVLQAVRLEGEALQQASQDLQNDREVVLAALKSDPVSLVFASEELQQDRDLVLTALRYETRRDFLIREDFADYYQTADLLEDGVSDKELVLAAARVGGTVLAKASSELRQDKDFVLEVMRTAPLEDQELCYAQADPSVHMIPFESFEGACNSVLAIPGEDAPVLTITLPPPDAATLAQSELRGGKPPVVSCQVSLLSGSSFTCVLPDAAPDPARDMPDGGEDKKDDQEEDEEEEAEEEEPSNEETERAHKRRRTNPNPTPGATVGQLAELVKAELLARVEVDPPPARIFLVFAKQDCEGEDCSIPATPWDWNRPATDFF